MKTRLKGRPLPPVYKKLLGFGEIREFTWRERLQIFLGYNGKIKFSAKCRYSPVDWDPEITFETTQQKPKKEGL